MDLSRPPEPNPTVGPRSVTHLSEASRTSLAVVLGSRESIKMTPELANNIDVLDEPLSFRMVPDQREMEINPLDRCLDILAAAELPTTGEQISVAIENQYCMGDSDHFGRLVG